jgi:alpha-tubulin suppressor-like RCC1 family protein
MMSASDTTTCSATSAGVLRCWGGNDAGQIGDGTLLQRRVATGVPALTSTHVVAGGGHTCAITAGGGVSCWGDNTYGELGDGTTAARTTPAPVSGLTSAVELAAGIGFTCARSSTGAVSCWGRGNFGQVGNGGTGNQLTPATVIGSGASAIIAGQRHACAVVSGAIWCWGRNQHGQVGDNTIADKLVPTAVVGSPANPVELAAGPRHTCARTNTGAMWCWGSNANGQLGDGTLVDHIVPGPVSASLTAVSDIAAGGSTTCAVVSSTQAIKCWGANSVGQVGDGTQIDRTLPVVIRGGSTYASVTLGNSHACAKLTAGGVRCWGGNDWGQLGDRTAARFPEAERISF